jgi:hypothetical protein
LLYPSPILVESFLGPDIKSDDERDSEKSYAAVLRISAVPNIGLNRMKRYLMIPLKAGKRELHINRKKNSKSFP